MFGKFKQLKDLKRLQDEFEKEKVEVEKQGIKVIVNGKMEIEEIFLNPELSKEEQEIVIRECVNEAINKIKMLMAQRMQQMPGMGF